MQRLRAVAPHYSPSAPPTVFTALEGFEPPTAAAKLARAIFIPDQHLEHSVEQVLETFHTAAIAFEEQLATLTLDQLLLPEALEQGLVDWNTH